jgi:hypothetical protein
MIAQPHCTRWHLQAEHNLAVRRHAGFHGGFMDAGYRSRIRLSIDCKRRHFRDRKSSEVPHATGIARKLARSGVDGGVYAGMRVRGRLAVMYLG